MWSNLNVNYEYIKTTVLFCSNYCLGIGLRPMVLLSPLCVKKTDMLIENVRNKRFTIQILNLKIH